MFFIYICFFCLVKLPPVLLFLSAHVPPNHAMLLAYSLPPLKLYSEQEAKQYCWISGYCWSRLKLDAMIIYILLQIKMFWKTLPSPKKNIGFAQIIMLNFLIMFHRQHYLPQKRIYRSFLSISQKYGSRLRGRRKLVMLLTQDIVLKNKQCHKIIITYVSKYKFTCTFPVKYKCK